MTNQTKRILCYLGAAIGGQFDLWVIGDLAHSAPNDFRCFQWLVEGALICGGCFLLCGLAGGDFSGPDKK